MGSIEKRCMVCGKPTGEEKGICRPCEESIRGEAAGKRKKIEKSAGNDWTEKPPPLPPRKT